MSQNNFLGHHLIIDLYDCDLNILDDEALLEQIMLESASIAGVTVIASHFHKFAPQGVSGTVIIAESHFNIHTWPEHNYAAIDLFTCGTGFGYDKAADYLTKQLKASRSDITRKNRGRLPVIDQ